MSLVDPNWELIDPNPNIWSLFAEFDKRFFNCKLTQSFVELMWSSNRMTSTAGLCCWNPRTNYATIKLSLPLLQLRSRSDLIETLLHEMIHAYLFVTREDDNHESHGPKFHIHMYRINKEAGTNITVYHTFHDEVRHYQQHVWRCDGSCSQRPPYFGYVRRANNRKPGPYDYWWSQHQSSCAGTFVKIAEPEKTAKPKAGKQGKITVEEVKNNKRIDDFFSVSPKKSQTQPIISGSSTGPGKKSGPPKLRDIRDFLSPGKTPPKDETPMPSFPGKGYCLGSAPEMGPPEKKIKTVIEEIISKPDISSKPRPESLPSPAISRYQPVPKKESSIENGSTSTSSTVTIDEDGEDSFTYDLPEYSFIVPVDEDGSDLFTYDLPDLPDLPDFEIPINPALETGRPIPEKNSSTEVSDLTARPGLTQVVPPLNSDEEQEDQFTYELPDFTPFTGVGHRLGSKERPKPPVWKPPNKESYWRPSTSKRPSPEPDIINLD